MRQIVGTVVGPDNAYFSWLIVSGLQMEIVRRFVHWDALLLSTKVYINYFRPLNMVKIMVSNIKHGFSIITYVDTKYKPRVPKI